MAFRLNTRTFYPQWHHKFKHNNPEFIKRIRNMEKENYQKQKLEKKNLRERRLMEYHFIDDKNYYFTWEDFQNFLIDKNFNISKCYIPNIIEREQIENRLRIEKEEKERIQKEEEDRLYLEYLKNYNEYDYENYFYEEEPFISDEEIIVYESDEEGYYSNDEF